MEMDSPLSVLTRAGRKEKLSAKAYAYVIRSPEIPIQTVVQKRPDLNEVFYKFNKTLTETKYFRMDGYGFKGSKREHGKDFKIPGEEGGIRIYESGVVSIENEGEFDRRIIFDLSDKSIAMLHYRKVSGEEAECELMNGLLELGLYVPLPLPTGAQLLKYLDEMLGLRAPDPEADVVLRNEIAGLSESSFYITKSSPLYGEVGRIKEVLLTGKFVGDLEEVKWNGWKVKFGGEIVELNIVVGESTGTRDASFKFQTTVRANAGVVEWYVVDSEGKRVSENQPYLFL